MNPELNKAIRKITKCFYTRWHSICDYQIPTNGYEIWIRFGWSRLSIKHGLISFGTMILEMLSIHVLKFMFTSPPASYFIRPSRTLRSAFRIEFFCLSAESSDHAKKQMPTWLPFLVASLNDSFGTFSSVGIIRSSANLLSSSQPSL